MHTTHKIDFLGVSETSFNDSIFVLSSLVTEMRNIIIPQEKRKELLALRLWEFFDWWDKFSDTLIVNRDPYSTTFFTFPNNAELAAVYALEVDAACKKLIARLSNASPETFENGLDKLAMKMGAMTFLQEFEEIIIHNIVEVKS